MDDTLVAGDGGGDNLLANNAPVNVRIGSDANLFSITDLQTGPPGTSLGPLMKLAPNSVVTNYGTLESYPQGYPSFNIPNQNNRSASIIQMVDHTVVNNYGLMGFMPEEADDNYGGVTVPCTIIGTTCNITGAVLNNYGLIVGDTPATTNQLPGPGLVVKNFAGAKMIAGGGSPVLGATSFNYQDGGLIDLKNDGSYCAHTGSGSNAYNWGYCLGIAVGYWMDQGRGQSVYDYGGPLVPSSIDMDGNIVFNGTISSIYFEDPGQASRQCPAAYSAFEIAPIHIVGNVTANFSNTIYQVGATKAIVNYLPLTYGWPLYSEPWNAVGQHTGPLSSTLNFNFAGLTPAQQQMIQAAVTAGSSSAQGSFTLDGQTYSWCPFMKVNVSFSNTIAGTGVNGFPIPGVSFAGPGGKPAYYTDAGHLTNNPYYLINAATVRLLSNLPLQPGRTVIAPGWTLVVGARLTTVVNNALVTTNYDDAFSGSAGASDSILIQTASAHTDGNINNVTGQTRVLSGALVIDNPTEPVTLPNLLGGGSLMQEGPATTTLAGTKNTILGPLYLADGTLKIAQGAAFTTPPRLIIGVNDWRQTYPVFDISELGAGQSFTLSALRTAGPQIQTGQVGRPVWYPTINLGASTLVVGTGKPDTSKFIGGLVGTGSLVLAPGTFLDLGGVSAYDLKGTSAVPISTYRRGHDKSSDGATLMLEESARRGNRRCK